MFQSTTTKTTYKKEAPKVLDTDGHDWEYETRDRLIQLLARLRAGDMRDGDDELFAHCMSAYKFEQGNLTAEEFVNESFDYAYPDLGEADASS